MYALSGISTSAIETVTEAFRFIIDISDMPTGKDFWLTGIWYGASATSGNVYVYDAITGASAGAGDGGTKILTLPAATVDGEEFKMFSFPDPGIKFSTGCCMTLSVSGSIAAGTAGANGYYR